MFLLNLRDNLAIKHVLSFNDIREVPRQVLKPRRGWVAVKPV